MLEELLALLRASATTLAQSPVAEQAAQDVRDVEAIAAKHVANAVKEAEGWLVKRLHPIFQTGDDSQVPPVQ